ncbi:methyl-accepting chemotaxis protein [Pelagicoccus sp. NFK12]|uniref:Methyl-accepting chemotaxis protein n=1 Tax=Pelagicoccus enzymogenes TaxID=2773457 RepID=A0A927IG93_9BACT|nr:methyl-accepting chemotaxis protein [Pelagicoccus enzymogenes]MBD5778921.1 methyl-accepting chemotaxis protein [Pelagicoccus enzymogenes]MDQ8197335.1 methyl-accepting chemotaxis protein [Pelagicoccus enzymogenes]
MNRDTQFENQFDERVHKLALWALAGHLPVMLGMAWHFETGMVLALFLTLAICAGPILLFKASPRSMLVPLSIGIAATSLSALLIHLSRGMIEMHFHIFVALAALIGLGSRASILAASVTTALHHIAFFFVLPSSIFNYDAGFGIVVVHAVFVVVIGLPATFVAGRYRAFVGAQGIIAGHLSEIAGSVGRQTSELSISARELAQGASRQAASIEETSASLEELSAATKGNAAHAQEANEHASRARQISEQGAAEVKTLTRAMDDIRKSSDSIATILKTIDEIAFQTNILALNAAVEAARAGEAGSGFAVVADEVRNLAQRSAKAAQETAKQVQDAVASSHRGGEISQSVAERLNDIYQRTCEVDRLVGEIATSSLQQSSGIQQISQAVGEIDKVTQLAASNAERTESDSGELNQLSSSLMNTLEMIEDRLGQKFSSPGEPSVGKTRIRSEFVDQLDIRPARETSNAKALEERLPLWN